MLRTTSEKGWGIRLSELFEKDFHPCLNSSFMQWLSFLVSITCSGPKYPERALHRVGVGSMGQKSGHLSQWSGEERLCCLHGLPKARGSPSASPCCGKISILTYNWNETNKIGNQNSSVPTFVDFKLLFWPSRDGAQNPFLSSTISPNKFYVMMVCKWLIYFLKFHHWTDL